MSSALQLEGNGTPGRAGALLTSAQQRWSAMPPAQRRMLLLCVTALAALTALSFWWSTRTDWRTLFSGLEGRDAAQVQQQLSAAGVTYQISTDGTLLQVPAEQLDKARVAVAAQGMPQSGRLGFELFDKPNWVGSEFDERVNYQRALEGELEHTVATLTAVRSARIHVVLPKHSAFASDEQPAKASVVLKLRRADLPRGEADSIRNLIAGAVEGLRADAVALIDADGRADLTVANVRGEQREEELALQNKLVAVLEPLTGAGNVHATVSLSYLEDSEEHTDETYDPQSVVPVSTQRTEQSAQSSKPGGVAGTTSNTPAAVPVVAAAAGAPVTPAPATGASISAGQAQTSREESSTFAVNRHVTHTESQPGRLRHIAAAIVINDRSSVQGTGAAQKVTWQRRSPEELQRIQQLARAAVGYDEKRGDQVVLENLSFNANSGHEEAETGTAKLASQAGELLRSQPALLRMVGSGIGLLIIGMLVLRPLTRQTTQMLALPAPVAELTGNPASLPGGVSHALSSPVARVERNTLLFDRVTESIQTAPQGSTRLIESWIGAGMEEAE